jgi:hypothetical protein
MPPLLDLCLIRPGAPGGRPPVLGVPLLDDCLRFVASRCRPNTVLAAAFDLKVFFTVVGKEPGDVRPVDVLAFVTAQRLGRSSIDGMVQPVDDNDEAGVSLRTVRRPVVDGVRAVCVPACPRRCCGEPGAARVADPPGTTAPASRGSAGSSGSLAATDPRSG